MKGNVCGMTHKKSMKLFKRFIYIYIYIFMKGNIKMRREGDKENLE